MGLEITIGVPKEVEISATGIPIHESSVEFCIQNGKVNHHFPAKMVEDGKFVFTITDDIANLANKDLSYKIYVYYENGRFEADSGEFRLLDATKDIKVSTEETPKPTPMKEEMELTPFIEPTPVPSSVSKQEKLIERREEIRRHRKLKDILESRERNDS